MHPVPGAPDSILPVMGDDLPCGHLVSRQGSGFVGANDRNRTQGLHGRQLARDRVLACHALHADCQGDGQDGGKAFRNRRHGKSDRREEQFSNRVVMQQPARQKHQCGQTQDHEREGLAESRHLPRERCGQGLDLGNHRIDAPEFRPSAGGGDDAGGAAGGHDAAPA